MTQLINTTEIPTNDILSKYSAGKFRFVVKTRLGMSIVDARDFDNPRLMENPGSILNGYKKGVLHTVEFQPEGSDYYFTIFSRMGKKVNLIDETILVNLKVASINSLFYNTNLYSQVQYSAVNSKTWDSYAYQMNEKVTA
jgi:hypothetical protein